MSVLFGHSLIQFCSDSPVESSNEKCLLCNKNPIWVNYGILFFKLGDWHFIYHNEKSYDSISAMLVTLDRNRIIVVFSKL